MKIGIFIVAHDGLQSTLTGVGIMVNSFIESFSEIIKEISFVKNKEIELIALAPYIKKDSRDFHINIQQLTKTVCKKNCGKLEEIPTFSDGNSQQSIWGNCLQWRSASLSAAATINSLGSKYDLIYVIGHDTIFSLLGKYLLPSKKIKFMWIPHSLGNVFTDEHTDDERILIEKEAIKSINNNPKYCVGYIGNSFKEILSIKYKVKKHKLIPMINGIYDKSERYGLSKKDIKNIEDKYKIPKNKKIIFSWGRCVQQKGYDLVIPAYKKFMKKFPNYHLILLMPTETSMKSYVRKVKNQLKSLPSKSFTAIYSFDSKLPYCILKNPNLKMVIFASRFEGNPIIGLEALHFHKNSKILYSKIDPLKKLFDNISFARGFLLSSGDLLDKMLKIESEEMIGNEQNKTKFVDNYIYGLNKFF